MEASKQPTPVLSEVFSRAVLDDAFREHLFEDRDAALGEYKLTDVDREYLDSVPKEKFEESARNMREVSVVGAAAPTAKIGIGGHFGMP